MVEALVKTRGFRCTIAALIALLAAGARTAAAHPENAPTLVNRYVTVMVSGGRLQIFVALLFGEIPARRERQRLDIDGDKRISPTERQSGARRWREAAAALASLTIDGAPARFTGGGADIQLGAEENVATKPLVIETHEWRPLEPGEHMIRVDLVEDPPDAGETEVGVELETGWDLLSSRQGNGPQASVGRVKFSTARVAAVEDRSVTFTFRGGPVSTSGGDQAVATRAVSLVAASIAALAIGAYLVLRRHARNEGQRRGNG